LRKEPRAFSYSPEDPALTIARTKKIVYSGCEAENLRDFGGRLRKLWTSKWKRCGAIFNLRKETLANSGVSYLIDAGERKEKTRWLTFDSMRKGFV
jgi:hypothetical protein